MGRGRIGFIKEEDSRVGSVGRIVRVTRLGKYRNFIAYVNLQSTIIS